MKNLIGMKSWIVWVLCNVVISMAYPQGTSVFKVPQQGRNESSIELKKEVKQIIQSFFGDARQALERDYFGLVIKVVRILLEARASFFVPEFKQLLDDSQERNIKLKEACHPLQNLIARLQSRSVDLVE